MWNFDEQTLLVNGSLRTAQLNLNALPLPRNVDTLLWISRLSNCSTSMLCQTVQQACCRCFVWPWSWCFWKWQEFLPMYRYIHAPNRVAQQSGNHKLWLICVMMNMYLCHDVHYVNVMMCTSVYVMIPYGLHVSWCTQLVSWHIRHDTNMHVSYKYLYVDVPSSQPAVHCMPFVSVELCFGHRIFPKYYR